MRFLFRLFLHFVFVIALVWVFRQPILDRLDLVAGTSARQTESEARGASGTAEPTARGRLSGLDLGLKARFALDPELKARERGPALPRPKGLRSRVGTERGMSWE